jgi:site-specific recombinase XerC
LNAPPENTLKGIRDRAILSVLLCHGIRRAELCTLKVREYERRGGVMHFRIEGKGEKVRYVPVATNTHLTGDGASGIRPTSLTSVPNNVSCSIIMVASVSHMVWQP